MARTAAGQYRTLATAMEERLRFAPPQPQRTVPRTRRWGTRQKGNNGRGAGQARGREAFLVAFARRKVGEVQEMAKRREEESMTLVHDPNDKAEPLVARGLARPEPAGSTGEDGGGQASPGGGAGREGAGRGTHQGKTGSGEAERRSTDNQDPSGIAMPVAKFGEKYMSHAREEFKQYRKHAPSSSKEKKRRKQKDPGLARRDVQAALFWGTSVNGKGHPYAAAIGVPPRRIRRRWLQPPRRQTQRRRGGQRQRHRDETFTHIV